MKTLVNTFIAFSLAVALMTGCTTKELHFVEPSCPTIQVLKTVPAIDGNITEGCVCGDQLDELLRGASQLRRSETYYIKQVGRYNDNFTTTLENSLDK